MDSDSDSDLDAPLDRSVLERAPWRMAPSDEPSAIDDVVLCLEAGEAPLLEGIEDVAAREPLRPAAPPHARDEELGAEAVEPVLRTKDLFGGAEVDVASETEGAGPPAAGDAELYQQRVRNRAPSLAHGAAWTDVARAAARACRAAAHH
jgi:hypothetical protein